MRITLLGAGHIGQTIARLLAGSGNDYAVHYWTAEAVRRTGVGALHVVANPQEWMDEFLPRMLELNVLMGEPPLPWTGPLSIEAPLAEEVLGQKLRALAAQASQTEMLRAAVGDDYYRRIFATERFRVQPL